MTEGIIQGVIAGVLLSVLSMFMRDWVWPKYKRSIYKGTKIDGKWDVYFEGKDELAATITFKQDGTKVEGHVHVFKDELSKPVDREYKCTGTFLNQSVTFTFEDINNPLMLGGAMVFYVTDPDVTLMKGKSVFYQLEKNDVEVSSVVLQKK